MSTKKKTRSRNVPTLAAVLGIEPAIEFTLLDGVYEARPLSLGDQMLLSHALDGDETDPLARQARALTKLLNDRRIEGPELTFEDVRDGMDLHTAQRLLQLLQGQRAPAVDVGDEGK